MTYIIFYNEDKYYIPEGDTILQCLSEFGVYMTNWKSLLFEKARKELTDKEKVVLYNRLCPHETIDEIYELGKKVI